MDNNLNDIRSRIQKRRMELDMSYQDLADKTGISKSSLQRYETGYIGSIGIDKVDVLARALNVEPSYIMGWADTPKGKPAPTTRTKQIPLVGEIAAGSPIYAEENVEEYLTVDERDDVNFALKVRGDSMVMVGIYPGDIIYVREQPQVNNGEIAAVIVDDGFLDSPGATVKRFFRSGDTVLLQPESPNPVHKTIEVRLDKGERVRVLGKVIFMKGYLEGR